MKQIEQARIQLKKKHLLIIGKSEDERRAFINDLIPNTNFEIFRFPSKMKLFDEYYNFVKKKRLYKPWYAAKSYNVNQILDFHWDWISENNSLIIIEEFQFLEKRWQIELLRIYLNEIENRSKGERKIHLIISQENENELIKTLSEVIYIRQKEKRSRSQIIEQNLGVINI